MKYLFKSICLLFLLNTLVHAQEFAYVTDSLQLRVFVSPSESSEVLQSIESGDSVEVFETQDGFSKVSTFDGTVGWVKSAFLVEEPPPKLLYYSVSEKNKQLEAEIETLKDSSNSSSTTATSEVDRNKVADLEAQLAEQQKTNQTLQQQLEQITLQQADAETNVSTTNNSAMSSQPTRTEAKHNYWFIALAVALLAGLLFGLKIASWRLQKRFHGYRI